jgi:uncharacterized protein with FMN-binding domain
MNSNYIFRRVMIPISVVLIAVGIQARCEARQERTKAEIDVLIDKAGSTPPDWWESTELRYPDTLDMNWPVQSQGHGGGRDRGGRAGRGGERRGRPGRGERSGLAGDSNVNVDQYLYNVIYPNPSRFKEGIKLVNHLMIMHRDDQRKLQRSLNTLGMMFYELMEDYARAAFWWSKYAERGGSVDPVKMARCYWELGSREMAVETLSKIPDGYRVNEDDVIRLWAKMGQVDKAIEMIKADTGSNTQAHSYLLAAEVYRQAGRYDEAIAYYQKVLALPDSVTRPRDHHDIDSKVKANANLETTRMLSTLDIRQVSDGTYTGRSVAYGGTLYIKVTMSKGRIESVEVTQHRETPSYYIMAEQTARQIVSKQGFEGVDVITGATMTSDAIINAAVKALADSVK